MPASPKSPETRLPSSNSSMFYMSLWLLAAIGAITYITMLATGSLPASLQNHAKAVEQPVLARDLARNRREQKQDETRLREIKSALQQTNTSLKQLNVKFITLDDRLSTIERKAIADQPAPVKRHQDNPITGALSAADRLITPPESTGAITRKAPATRKQTPDLITTPEAIPTPIVKPKTIEKPEQQKIAAAIIQKPITQKPAAKPEKQQGPVIMRTMFAVSLGNFPDLAQLKKAWASLSKKHENALGTLKPRYLTLVVDNRPQYQLITGPLDNALEAAKICYYLQQMKTYCRQTVFHGTDI